MKLVVHRRVDYPPGGSWLNRFKYINQRIDRYIAISQAIGDILIDYGVPKESISIVRSAVDPSPFEGLDRAKAREKLLAELGVTLPASTPIIGNLAYITEQKGHETLVRALGILKAQGLPFFAFIAGDGELRQMNETLASTLNLEANLKFLGIRKDVPELLAATDIFALSSNDEGLGTSLLDATHSGCCLVATSVGGIPEIITHKQTGLLSAAKDHKAFAINLTQALQSQALRETLANNAKAHVRKRFSLEQMVEGNLEIYRQLTHKS
ncbi:MAG: glycosyltransferase family 1 protein [Proteobacteria bacterium]|nr:MAG: glycosyltransferase family 1 protein [Pseudomonadota bacterium]